MGACECNNPIEYGYEVSSQTNASKDNKEIKKEIKDSKLKESIKNIYIDNMFSSIDSTSNKNNSNDKIIQVVKNDNSQLEDNQNDKNQQIINNINNHHFAEERAFSNLSCSIPENKKMIFNENFYYNCCKSLSKPNNNDNYGIEEIPKDEFSKYIFEKINQIRENPSSFVNIIEKAKKNISIDEKKGILIYKTTVKIALFRGEPSFDETIELLKNLSPMEKLIYRSELAIPPPNNLSDLVNKQYMNEKINEIVESGIFVKSFWRDIIKDPETCFILMIVDDTGLNGGLKRNDILDPDTKYIGISSKLIGKNFASYVTLG